MDESRKAFEKWCKTVMTDDADFCMEWGDYSNLNVRLRWEAWKASREAIEIELPPVCDAHSDDIDKGYDICHYRTQECLKKQGIRFKIEGSERWSQPSAPLESK
ncbi:TPA: hypothetical protein OMS42_002037 [Enterobacter kobei]|nr:hypothetical protein [Enterobacter kobei]